MRPRDREVEVDEAQVTVALIVALIVGAGIFYLGLWVGGWLAGGSRAMTPPAVTEAVPTALPAGFVGPPAPAYPPPVGGMPGAGKSGNLAIAIQDVSGRNEAERALGELLAKGYPAYLSPTGQDRWQLRVGDYGTVAEAEAVRAQLSAAGTPESGLLEL